MPKQRGREQISDSQVVSLFRQYVRQCRTLHARGTSTAANRKTSFVEQDKGGIMAAPPPDHVAKFNISLDDVALSPMVNLSEEQQRDQMSTPFERHGMYWLLAVEKEAPANGGNGFDIMVVLYCLSVPVTSGYERATFPLKGEIVCDGTAQDGQAQVFNATTGACCNLIGKQFPANAVHMRHFAMQLVSGQTEFEEIEVSLLGPTDGDGEGWGGFYGEGWRGAGGTVLFNHVIGSVHDGASFEVKLWFTDTPRAMRYVDLDP